MENLDAVRETEEHLMNAWPSLRTLACNGWVFRQAGGYTKRANSANALDVRGPFEPTLVSARKFYESFECPTIFRLTPLAGPEPDRILASLGFEVVDETLVMKSVISDGAEPDAGFSISTSCTEDWEAGYAAAHGQDSTQRLGHRAILKSIAPLQTAFATIHDEGRPVAFGLGVIERGNGAAHVVVVVRLGKDGVAGGACLQRERTLAGGGAEFVDCEALMHRLGAVEAVESGRSQHQRVALAFCELSQPRVDISAQLDESDVRPQSEQLSAAARAGRPDGPAHGQRVQRPVLLADPDVAGVGARRDGGQGKARIERGGQVLERVDGEVDAAVGEGVFDLLGEDSFAGSGGRF